MAKKFLKALFVTVATAGVVLAAGCKSCDSCNCSDKCESKTEKKCDSKK